MNLLDRIPEGAVVAVDSAPWIYVLESHPLYAPILRPLFDDRFAQSRKRAGASILVLGELLVQPLTQGRDDVADAYRQFFADPARVATWMIDQPVVDRAAGIRARCRLKMIDALHIASALVNGAAVFITNDAGFRRILEIPVIVLDDYLTPSTNSPTVP